MPLIEEIKEGENRIGIWGIDGSELDHASENPDLSELLSVKHPRTQLQRVASRLLLTAMLGELPVVEKDGSGKPHLPDHPWEISISHTEGYAAIMLGKGKVGIDVQNYRPTVLKVKDRFLDERELAMAADVETATLFWAAKEAIYKYNGKHGLDFKHPISVHSIELETLNGSFVFEGKRTPLTLGWKRLNGAVLVWTCDHGQ